MTMQRSESIKELAAALAKAQQQMRHAVKDSLGQVGQQKVPYADLASVFEAIRDPLASNGLALSQHPSFNGEIVSVESLLMHASGEWLTSVLQMRPAQTTPQAVGSAITYARRYGAMAIVGLAADDDDGAAASKVSRPSGNGQVRTPGVGARPPTSDSADQRQTLYDDEMPGHRNILANTAKRRGISDPKVLFELRKACFDTPIDALDRAVVAFMQKQPGAAPA